MTCNSCVKNIESTVGAQPGVLSAQVDLKGELGVFLFDPGVSAPDIIASHVEDMGFEARVREEEEEENLLKFILSVGGMTCQACVKSIEGAVGAMPKVKGVSVSLEEETAFVKTEMGVQASDMAACVEDAGFDAVVVREALISVEGMTCGSCVKTIEEGVREEPGVKWIKVDLKGEEAKVRFVPSVLDAEAISTKIYDMGFDTKVLQVKGDGSEGAKKVEETPSSEGGDQASSTSSSKNAADYEQEENLSKCFVAIEGMTCASCVAAIEKHVKKMRGVHSILVALMAAKAEVTFDPRETNPKAVSDAITELGFPSTVLECADVGNGSVELTVRGKKGIQKQSKSCLSRRLKA